MLSFATVLAALVATSSQQSADVAVKQPAPFPQSGEAPIEAGPFYPPIPGDVNPLPNAEVPFGPRQPPPLPPNFEGGPAPLTPVGPGPLPAVPSFPGGEGSVVPFPGPGPQPLPAPLPPLAPLPSPLEPLPPAPVPEEPLPPFVPPHVIPPSHGHDDNSSNPLSNGGRCQDDNGTLLEFADDCEDELKDCDVIFGVRDANATIDVALNDTELESVRPKLCDLPALFEKSRQCAKTCKVCCERAAACKDYAPGCEGMRGLCRDFAFHSMMSKQCPKTCGQCVADEAGEPASTTPSGNTTPTATEADSDSKETKEDKSGESPQEPEAPGAPKDAKDGDTSDASKEGDDKQTNAEAPPPKDKSGEKDSSEPVKEQDPQD